MPKRNRLGRRVIETHIDGEAILYDPAAHEALLLNSTAYQLWTDATADTPASRITVDSAARRCEHRSALLAMHREGWLGQGIGDAMPESSATVARSSGTDDGRARTGRATDTP